MKIQSIFKCTLLLGLLVAQMSQQSRVTRLLQETNTTSSTTNTTSTSTNTTNSTATVCPTNCTQCTPPSTSPGSPTCTACKVGFVLDSTPAAGPVCRPNCTVPATVFNFGTYTCTLCPVGTIFANGTCQTCQGNCSSCLMVATSGIQICKGCNSGFIFDTSTNVSQCKPSCPVNEAFDLTRKMCNPCPSNTWYNSTSQTCNTCPTLCSACNVTTAPGTAATATTAPLIKQCTSCEEGNILDKAKYNCRAPCNSSQYFDWTSMSCLTCKLGQFGNITNNICTACPAKCGTCNLNNQTSALECQTCTTGFIFDNEVKNCKLVCNSTAQFDWLSGICKQCPLGSFLNPETLSCKNCTQGCLACNFNKATNNSQCTSCDTTDNQTSVLDVKMQTCRPACQGIAQWDWPTQSCTDCQDASFVNMTTQQCTPCPMSCTTCQMTTASLNKAQCGTCIAGSQLDSTNQLCRTTCDSTQFFDWKSMSCMNCSISTYGNVSSNTCQACPKNCQTCNLGGPITNQQVQCQTCKTGSLFDLNMQNCKLQCNTTSQFDWISGICKQCPKGTFLNQTMLACQNCTAGCLACNFNNQTNNSQCTQCDTTNNQTSVLDIVGQQCRPACQGSAQFNWESQDCSPCMQNQFINQTSQLCKNCPMNCTSCQLSTTNQLQCGGCEPESLLDNSTLLCRTPCNSTQSFDWKSASCLNCVGSTYGNVTNNTCLPCPKNCKSCNLNQNNQPQCQTCNVGSLLDNQMQNCKLQCNTTAQFDWNYGICKQCPLGTFLNQTILACQNCTPGCLSCVYNNQTNNSKCLSCDTTNNQSSVLDIVGQQCRPACEGSASFDWPSQTCIDCQSDQLINMTSQQCQQCPTNCSSCFVNNATKKSQCTSCANGTTLDNSTVQLCHTICNSTQFFDWKTSSCLNCSVSTYGNLTKNICTACPTKCKSCDFNDQSQNLECQTCNVGSLYDSNMRNCKLICNNTAQFDWTSNICKQCPLGTFLNQTILACQNCTPGCLSCVYNSATNNSKCLSCDSTNNQSSVLDIVGQQCRPVCEGSASFDWSSQTCIDCQSDQLINTTSQKCQQCPSNCTSCNVNNITKIAQCGTCSPNSMLDNSTQLCRIMCNSSQKFDWKSFACINCIGATYGNVTNNNCLACPKNCKTCNLDPLTNQIPQCLTCNAGSLLDTQMQNCKLQCNTTAQFDWNTGICRQCPAGTFLNQTTLACQKCNEGCLSCVYNSATNYSKCLSCDTTNNQTAILDSSMSQCRPTCPPQQGWDWSSLSCAQCQSNQIFNVLTQSCQQCPSNCTSCFVSNTTKKTQCDACEPNSMLDNSTQLCRIMCNSTQSFDWKSFSCIKCIGATYGNITSNTCLACPKNCKTCNLDSTNTIPQCQTCNVGSIIDNQMQNCKLQCNTSAQFDWNAGICKQCPVGTFLDQTILACQKCNEGCLSCAFNTLTNTSKCLKCDTTNTQTSILDSNNLQCRPDCRGLGWDWPSMQCQGCLPDQIYNATRLNCQQCPSNCTSCFVSNKTNKTQCGGCGPNSVFENSTQLCRFLCNSSQFYSWPLSSCINCVGSTYGNNTNNNCQACPKNCKTCNLDSTNTIPQCQTCNVGSLLDNQMQNCKLQCNNTAQFDWNSGICRECPLGTFLNQSSLACQQCTPGCLSCKFNTKTNASQCIKCDTTNNQSAVLDVLEQQCRPACEGSASFDWPSQTCLDCNSEQFINMTSQQCQQCPSNCTSCFVSATTNKTQCGTCTPNSMIDNSTQLCRIMCNSTSSFDWKSFSCRNCTGATYGNVTSNTCLACPKNCKTCNLDSTDSIKQCQTCNIGSLLDSQMQNCKLQCNKTAQFDWNAGICRQCPLGTFLNQTILACQDCTPGCLSCQFNPNTNASQCLSCNKTNDESAVLDIKGQQCRPACLGTAQFDWATQTCLECESNQFINNTSQICQSCPSNCSTCSFNFTKNKSECSTCMSGNQMDNTKKLCRNVCNSTATWNWATLTCSQCPVGTWLNPSNFTCQACPGGCTQCNQNPSNTSIAQCVNCTKGFYIQNDICRIGCQASQYFDWPLYKCLNCTFSCLACNGYKSCIKCLNSYYLQQGECFAKCDLTQGLVWNNKTQNCTQQNIVMKVATNNIVVNVNTPFDLEDQGYEAANLIIDWIPQISQVLFNVEFSSNTQISMTFNSSLNNNTRGNFSAGGMLYFGDQQIRQNQTGMGDVLTTLIASMQPRLNKVQPLWLQEGISAYIRYFLFEGIQPVQEVIGAFNYSDNEEITAIFLNWIVQNRRQSLITDLTYALQMNTYTPKIWVAITNDTIDQLFNDYLYTVPQNITVTVTSSAESQTVYSCQNVNLNATVRGMIPQIQTSQPTFTWSVNSASSNDAFGSYQQFINEANNDNLNTTNITLPEGFSSAFYEENFVAFTVEMSVSGQLYKGKTYVDFQPYALAVVGNYNYSYTVDPAQGIEIQPTITIPDCGASYTPIPASNYIVCTLLDQNFNFLQTLTECNLPPWNTMSVQQPLYFIQMNLSTAGSTIAFQAGSGISQQSNLQMPLIDNQISTLIDTITIYSMKPSNVTNSTTGFLQNTDPVLSNQQGNSEFSFKQQVSSLVLTAIIFIELALAVGYAYSHSNNSKKDTNLRENQTERKMIANYGTAKKACLEGGDDSQVIEEVQIDTEQARRNINESQIESSTFQQLISQQLGHAKIVRAVVVTEQGQNFVTILTKKLSDMYIFHMCFFITSCLSYAVDQTMELALITYACVAIVEMFTRFFESRSKTISATLMNLFIGTLVTLSLVQSMVMMLNVQTMSESAFTGWLLASFTALVLSCIVQDMMVVPLARCTFRLFNKSRVL